MKKWLADGLNLVEFKIIVVNADNEPISPLLIAKEAEEESKQSNFQGACNQIKLDSPTAPQIYSIKVATDAKTEDDIIRLVKEEIGIVDDDVEIWNQMMRTITRLSIGTDHPIKGKNVWRLKPQPSS